MVDPKIVSKIQKLLSLGADNENGHEADAAMKKAAQLAAKHGLAIADIDIKTNTVGIDKNNLNMSHKHNKQWEGMIGMSICTCFDCQIISTVWRGENTWTFLGAKSDLDIALWYFKYLRIKIIRTGKKKFKLVKDRKSYGIGAAHALHSRLMDNFYTERKQSESVDTKALVVMKKEEVTKEMHKIFPNLRTTRSRTPSSISREAFETGVIDGQTMPLTRGHIT